MSRLLLSVTLVSAIAGAAAGLHAAGRQAAPQASATPPSVEATVPADYVIGPQDVLGIIVWRETEVSGDLTVLPDGKITVPVIGEVAAAGMTPSALQKQLQVAAAKYFTDPNVSVVVRTINSRRVFVTGRVTTPGSHPLTGPLTVMQAIAMAGGLTEYADAKNITILRTERGYTVILKFNYKDVSRGKSLEQNVLLRPGDTVVVP